MTDCDVCICLIKSLYIRADLAPLAMNAES